MRLIAIIFCSSIIFNGCAGKKSIRDIIREVLERHEKTQQTFPVPLYDSIYWDRMENVA